MNLLNSFNNPTSTIQDFHERGFSRSFRFENNELICFQNGKSYSSNQVKIVEYHRFKGDAQHPNKSIVFALECLDGEKGYIIFSDKNYANIKSLEFMDKVKIKVRQISSMNRRLRAS